MTRFGISLSFGAAALGLFLAAAPAQAKNFVSYVSLFTGKTGNDCRTPATACYYINDALKNTEPGGEIKCLDNQLEGIFAAAVKIEQPVTIDCGAPNSLMVGFYEKNAITINLDAATYPNGVVTLRNLNINGFLEISYRSRAGIRVIGGGAAVFIENCKINGFLQQGIDFEPTSSTMRLFVRDTTISNNAGSGILVKPTGASSSKVVLDNVHVEYSNSGIRIDGTATTGTNIVTIRNSTVSYNTGFGLSAADGGSGFTHVMVESSTSNGNGTTGVLAAGANVQIRMRDSTSTENATGLNSSGEGQLFSHGGNVIAGNNTDGSFTNN